MTKIKKSFLKSNIHGIKGEICLTYPYRTFYALDMTVTVVYAWNFKTGSFILRRPGFPGLSVVKEALHHAGC